MHGCRPRCVRLGSRYVYDTVRYGFIRNGCFIRVEFFIVFKFWARSLRNKIRIIVTDITDRYGRPVRSVRCICMCLRDCILTINSGCLYHSAPFYTTGARRLDLFFFFFFFFFFFLHFHPFEDPSQPFMS